MFRSKILSVIQKFYLLGMRILKCERFSGDNHNMQQFHSGGEDYNPPSNVIPLCVPINENNSEFAIVGYVDKIPRTALEGEKIIYATNSLGNIIVASTKLDNLGNRTSYTLKDYLSTIVGLSTINVTGNFTLTVLSTIAISCLGFTFTSTKLNINATTFKFDGDVEDDSTTTPSMQDMRDTYNTHTHGGGGSVPDQQM